jgi:hypothetical protein
MSDVNWSVWVHKNQKRGMAQGVNAEQTCPVQRDWYKMSVFGRKPETGDAGASQL